MEELANENENGIRFSQNHFSTSAASRDKQDISVASLGGVRSTPGCAPTVSRGGSPGRGFATYKNSQQRAKARAFRHEDPK